MTRIAVSATALVDYSPERWRLIQVDSASTPELVVEAKSGAPFRYNGAFAVSRDLPDAGEILEADLGQVVLGWSQESASWQLGITLSPEISLARSSRWFELLRFTHPDASVFEPRATQLGSALAQTLGIPFAADSLAPAPPPEPEPVPLPPLPLDLGMWRMEEGADAEGGSGESRLLRERRWLRAKQRQFLWYALLIAAYLWVSIATLNNDLALPNAGTLIPNPAWLPWLGIGVAVALVLLNLRVARLILGEPDRVVVNRFEKSVAAMRGSRQRWKVSAGNIQSVYVSEQVKKRGRRPTVMHGEINLHMLDGSFRPLLVERDKLVDCLLPGVDHEADKLRPTGVNPLEAADANTALQAAGAHIAASLGDLPVWYDRRLK